MPNAKKARGFVAAAAVCVLVASCSSAEDIAGNGPTTPTQQETTRSTGSSPTTEPTGSPSPSEKTSPTTSDSSSPAHTTTPSNGHPSDGIGAGPPGKGLQRFYQQDVSWTSCGSGDECASIWVPMSYQHPDGKAITIKAKRQPAGKPSKRIGSLFINPGGPGGSGIDYLDNVGFPPQITNVYDVVGFDPRGVGQSTPIDCVSDDFLDTYLASDPSPDNKAEINRMEQLWRHFTKGCVKRSGKLLSHVSTVEAARDMDILRAVVGDKKFHYFGASYGTYLGATYAALFPEKVGRMVLDGAVNPLEKPRKTEIKQAAGFETALTAYIKNCISEGDCPLGNSVKAAKDRLQKLFRQVDQDPLPTSSGRKLTEGLAFLGVIVPLYNRQSWRYETLALKEALNGSGNLLLRFADLYASRGQDGHYTDNSMEVQSAVNCLDKPQHASIQDIKQGKQDFLQASPTFGPAAMWWPYACSHWPVSSSIPQPDYSAKGAAPIVVIGTTRDPATPYEQAVKLANILDSGVLLSRDGDGHTAYNSGNACIDDAVNTYLVTGNPPKDGTMCR